MATGPVKNATPKRCRDCGEIFTPVTRAQRYCDQCQSKRTCIMCGKPLNIHQSRVRSRRRKCFDCHRITASETAARGEAIANWAGGRKKTSGGYVDVLAKDHPRANRRGYIAEHVLVAERTLGRYLKRSEVVHHKNRIKDDNRPENLQVMTKREHDLLHLPGANRARWSGR